MKTMGSHQSTRMETDIWLTPKFITDALGEFDLDPCHIENPPWLTAKRHITLPRNGLQENWNDERVWLNPPYSREAEKWIQKLAAHGNGIALIFARTETRWFKKNVWDAADSILFLADRIYFCNAQGESAKANAGAPSCLVAYGDRNTEALISCGIKGSLVTEWIKT